MAELGGDKFEAFNRRKHRNSRCNNCIARKQGCAQNAENKHDKGLAANGALSQCHKGKRTAFAIIIRAQNQHDIFDGDADHKRP